MILITSNACGDVSPSANAVNGMGETSDQVTEEGSSTVDIGDMKQAVDTVKSIRCNGRIEVPPQFKADIYARTPGYIETLHVLRGEKVKKGDLLATLSDQSTLELQRSYLTSKLEVAQLAKVYERHQQLFKNQAVSEKELERSKTAYEQEQTNLKALTAQLKFIGLSVPSSEAALSTILEIRSPMDGFVNRVEANTGRRVQENQALFEVIDDSHKHIELDVFPNQAGRIALNQRVIIRPSGGEKEAEGYVYLINSAIDDVKQTVNVHVHLLEDRADLRVSSYVEARILTDQIIVDAPANGH